MRVSIRLPDNEGFKISDLAIAPLSRVFDKTTASYKFFWFLSLLELHGRNMSRRSGIVAPGFEGAAQSLSFASLAAMMIAKAWYPITVFKLSFGAYDSLGKIISDLLDNPQIFAELDPPLEPLTQRSTAEEVYAALCLAMERSQRFKRKILDDLCTYVPYYFLTPWLSYAKTQSQAKIIKLSKLDEGCLYKITGKPGGLDNFLIVNSGWADYLLEHRKILEDFATLSLVNFLERRNPVVPNIINKLISPLERENLTFAKIYFNSYLQGAGHAVRSIYTSEILGAGSKFAVDHFLPWSFVGHNEIWNLCPIDQSTNSSKSDKLPDLEIFLPKLAQFHQDALKVNFQKLMAALPESKNQGEVAFAKGEKKAFKEAGQSFTEGLRVSLPELHEMSKSRFEQCFFDTLYPLYLQARNLSFEEWGWKLVNEEGKAF